MPTLNDLQRNQPKPPLAEILHQDGEELIADIRGNLSPSQVVERKLAARAEFDVRELRSSSPFKPR